MGDPFASRYRVFISYSHSDERIVRCLEEILKARGLVPMRDKHFAYGVGFHGQIQRFIEHAHVFMPVITEESSRRGWVQQEIGYAMAQNVPVLPIAVSRTPGEWLQSLHAVVLDAAASNSDDDIAQAVSPLDRILASHRLDSTPRLVEKLIRDHADERFARYTCAYLQEDRTAAITRHANDVYAIQVSYPELPVHETPAAGEHRQFALSSFVRQKGGLSSFHIPDAALNDPVWKVRYGPKEKRSEHHCVLQRGERQALERHAAEWGARIIVDPTLPYRGFGGEARRVRLQCLLDILEDRERIPCLEVAINTEMSVTESLTIVGSWFLAQSVTANAKQGYYQTILTRHAPSMQARIEAFDEEFEDLLERAGSTPGNSREHAIQFIRDELDRIPRASVKRKIPRKG